MRWQVQYTRNTLSRFGFCRIVKLNESTRAFTVKEKKKIRRLIHEIFSFLFKRRKVQWTKFHARICGTKDEGPEKRKSIELTIKIPKTIENNFICLLFLSIQVRACHDLMVRSRCLWQFHAWYRSLCCCYKTENCILYRLIS